MAFSQIFSGGSEIAKFSFNDVFSLLSQNSKLILFSMIAYGDKPVSRHILMHLADLTEDKFEDSIKELITTSFVFTENKEIENRIVTEFSMLTLTRGFVETKLDEDKTTKVMLMTRYHHLSEQIQELEKSVSSYSQLAFSLGIKTTEEKIAFNYVKTAKKFYENSDIENAEKNYELALKIAPRLSYVLTEYSKFEFTRGHCPKALELGKKATEVDPESHHVWFNYGICLRKAHRLSEAIKYLQKAKELNPKHLPIFSELGRIYTLTGDYEKAEAEFIEALKEEKYPNYRHKMMTLQFLANNYRQWSRAFESRRDSKGQINMLKKAFETIQKAREIDPKDKRLLSSYWDICKSYGIVLSKEKGFAEGKAFFEKCIQPIHVGQIQIIPDGEPVAAAYFHLARLNMAESSMNMKEIESYINRGLANCVADSYWLSPLNNLKKQLLGENTSEANVDDRKYGRIKYYNEVRKFGIITISNERYLFFLSGFSQFQSPETLPTLNGRTISCILKKNPEKSSLIATDIVLEGCCT